MTGDRQAPGHRLARLGLTLPEPLPVAAFQPCVRSGPAVYVRGQVTGRHGHLVASGWPGAGIAAGQAAARVCPLNVLAQMHAAPAHMPAPRSASARLPLGTPVEAGAIAEFCS